jgi:hypothetical protein
MHFGLKNNLTGQFPLKYKWLKVSQVHNYTKFLNFLQNIAYQDQRAILMFD